MFVTSLIFVVCVAGIQQVGATLKAMFTNNAEKTKIMDPSQK